MESIRVELRNGQWWDIKPILTHIERRAIDKANQTASLITTKAMQDLGIDTAKLAADAEEKVETIAKPKKKSYMPEAEDLILLKGSAAWSFEGPINAQAIALMDGRDTKRVLAAMKKLYELEETDDEANFTAASSASPSYSQSKS